MVPFEQAYQREFPTILRYMYRAVGDEEKARDLTQDVFLRVLASDREHSTPEIFGIASGLAAAVHRRRHDPELMMLTVDNADVYDNDPVLRHALEQALDGLDAGERRVYDLVRVEGYSQIDAAEVLGVSRRHVRDRLYLADLHLQHAMAEYAPQSIDAVVE